MEETYEIFKYSLFSGFAGATISSLITFAINYYNDQRKFNNALSAELRAKKNEIGENLYFIYGESLSMFNRHIHYYENTYKNRSRVSMDYLNNEIREIHDRNSQLEKENWKYNLAPLYFDIQLSHREIIDSSNETINLFLNLEDISQRLIAANTREKNQIEVEYFDAINRLIAKYRKISERIEVNMESIKNEILHQYKSR